MADKNIKSRITSYFKSFHHRELNDTLYHISIWLVLFIIICYGIFFFLEKHFNITIFTDCFILKYFHIYCPGCGGTRAILYFFKGQFFKAVCYNAFAVYLLVMYLLFFISNTLSKLSKYRIKGLKIEKYHFIIGLIILLFQFIFKNTILP